MKNKRIKSSIKMNFLIIILAINLLVASTELPTIKAMLIKTIICLVIMILGTIALSKNKTFKKLND